MKPSKLLSQGWCQNKDELHIGETNYYCFERAVEKCYGEDTPETRNYINTADEYVRSISSNFYSAVAYNDYIGRKQEEIINLAQKIEEKLDK